MIAESVVQSTTITNWMQESATAVSAQCDYLTQLDSAIGDGDHGLNMRRGFDSVTKALAGQDDSLPPGRLLIVAGKTSGLDDRRGERPALGHGSPSSWAVAGRSHRARRRRISWSRWTRRWMASLTSVPPRRVTRRWSTLWPRRSTRCVTRSRPSGPLRSHLTAAAEAAEEGMRATIPMQARKGRASYLGERSVGHQDPGATSTALIVRALEAAVAAED